MLLGFNYPYSRYQQGAQIGPFFWVDPAVWAARNAQEAAGNLSFESIPPPPLFDHIDRNLCHLKRIGISVVRWYLLGNGNNYGPAPKPVRRMIATPKGSYGSEDREFDPPRTIDRRFRRDFRELLERFRKAELKLIPSLIDYQFGAALRSGPNENGTGWGGRADVIRDATKRKVFLDTMLAELLAASAGYEDQIYAWEVINEPIWLCVGYGPLSAKPWLPRLPEVGIGQMKEFLKEAIARIQKAGFKATVGHRYYGDLTLFPSGDKPQFHFYAEHPWYHSLVPDLNKDPARVTARINNAKLFAPLPVGGLDRPEVRPILGEFDSAENRWGNAWDKTDLERVDPRGVDSTFNRIKLLEVEGCELALIWGDYGGAKDDRKSKFPTLAAEMDAVQNNDVLQLQQRTQEAITKFTGGKIPAPSECDPPAR